MESGFGALGGNSPIKGLEKLGEDLRQERQKATLALQDRAKLKIEVESLKTTVQQQSQELKDVKSFAENMDLQNLQLQQGISLITEEKHALMDEVASLRSRVADLTANGDEATRTSEQLSEQLQQAKDQMFTLTAAESALEARVAVKDEQIIAFRSEIENLRSAIGKFEEKENKANLQYADKVREFEELKSRIQQAEILKESYHQHMMSTEEIKRELEKSLSHTQFLSQQLRDSTIRVSDQHTQIVDLEAKLRSMTEERNVLSGEKHDLERVIEELSGRLRMEAEMASTEHRRAEACARSKEFLEQQVEEMRSAHSLALEDVKDLQDRLAAADDKIAVLEADIEHQHRRETELEEKLEEAQQAHSVAAEVEHLRAQLNEVRKQLIKRGIDDEANVVNPKSALERESQSREVYEGIIVELRSELDRANSRYHDASRRLEEARSLAVKVDQLQEEVQMYRDTAKAAAIETQSVAITASEAVERSVRNTHDKHILLSNLKQAEITVQTAQKEVQRHRDELAQEKQKHKGTYLEKLSAERRVSELVVAKARAETELDTYRQNNSTLQHELDRLKRQLSDQQTIVDDCKRRAGQADSIRQELDALRLSFSSCKADFGSREQELVGELQIVKQTKFLLAQEVESLKQKLDVQKRNLEASQQDAIRARNEVADIRSDKERQRKEFALQESSRADAQLQSLRRELEQTMSDWQVAEREKEAKDEAVQKINRELSKEREKASLLKTQVALLDERLRVAYQELSVYRSLDVYHTSLQSELHHQRMTKSSPEKGDRLSNSVEHSHSNRVQSRSSVHSVENLKVESPVARESQYRGDRNTVSSMKLSLRDISTNGHSLVDASLPNDRPPLESNNIESFESRIIQEDNDDGDYIDVRSVVSDASWTPNSTVSAVVDPKDVPTHRKSIASTENNLGVRSNSLNHETVSNPELSEVDEAVKSRHERELARAKAIRSQMSSSAPARRDIQRIVGRTPTTSNSNSTTVQSLSSVEAPSRPNSVAGNSKSIGINPLKADFERARRLLAKSGR